MRTTLSVLLFQTTYTRAWAPFLPTPVQRPLSPVQPNFLPSNGAPLKLGFEQRPGLLRRLRYKYMAPGLSLSRRRVARACGMEGPRFPDTQTHPYGLSFTLAVRKPGRGVFSQSRSSHQPTPPVRTPRRPIPLTLLIPPPFFSLFFSFFFLSFFFFFPFPRRLLHDLSVYVHSEGKRDSDAVRRSALLDYRRRLELDLPPLVREQISFHPPNSLLRLTHHLPSPPPRMHKLSRQCPLAVPARCRPPPGPPRGAAALQGRARATSRRAVV